MKRSFGKAFKEDNEDVQKAASITAGNASIESNLKSSPASNSGGTHPALEQTLQNQPLVPPLLPFSPAAVVPLETEKASNAERKLAMYIRKRPQFEMTLDDCKAFLRRDKELERANAPGRHKEADRQMKKYMATFGNVLTMPAARSPPQRRSHLAASLPLHAAQDYQRAVAKEMRQQQQQNRNSVEEDTAEPSLENIMDLHLRNRAREEAACMMAPP